MKLQDMLDGLLGREQGYTNNPIDGGGETNWGITVAVARAFGYAGPMRDMPRNTACAIYTKRYWLAPLLDQVARCSDVVAEELLDTGVNMGPAVAGKFLQRALNVLGRTGRLYPKLTVDGNIGAMTLYALQVFLDARATDHEGETVLLRMLNAQQSVRYIELAENNPNQEAFEFGWQSNRVGGL